MKPRIVVGNNEIIETSEFPLDVTGHVLFERFISFDLYGHTVRQKSLSANRRKGDRTI
jgi:hypothetical protein